MGCIDVANGPAACSTFQISRKQAIALLAGKQHIRDAVRESFDYILMDELQDTNPLQWRLLDLIRRPQRFFGVGDINQSIYGFRHADPEVFREYRASLESAGHPVDELREKSSQPGRHPRFREPVRPPPANPASSRTS